MPTIRTRSYAPGTRSSTFTKGTTTKEETWSWSPPPSGGESGNETVQITANRTTATAPGGIFFTAAATGFFDDPAGYPNLTERHYHEVRYKWTFGDPNSLFTRLPEDMPWDRVYLLSDGTTRQTLQGDEAVDGEGPAGSTFLGCSANTSYGPHCGHAFAPTPEDFGGAETVTFTVTCEATTRARVLAGLNPIKKTIDVTIRNPDTYYGDQNTIYVSPTSDFPVGASNTATTWYDAVQIARELSRFRVLLNRGETHDTAHPALGNYSSGGYRSPGNYTSSQVGAYLGPQSEADGRLYDPICTSAGGNIKPRADTDTGVCASWGLNFQGTYDTSRAYEMGSSDHPDDEMGIGASEGRYMTVWNCRADGWQRCLATGSNARGVIISNVQGSNWYDYGHFANTGLHETAIVGLDLSQPNDCIGANSKTGTPGYPDHGPWRVSFVGGRIAFDMCNFRSRNSHAGGYQPCIRCGGRGNSDSPYFQKNLFNRLVLDGAGGIGTGTYAGALYPKSAIYDKIYQLPLSPGGRNWQISAPGVTIRNVICALHDGPTFSTGMATLLSSSRQDPNDGPVDPTCYESPVYTYNNTILDFRNDANYSASQGNNLTWTIVNDVDYMYNSEFLWENSVIHVPNRSDYGVDTSNSPLDATVLMWDRDFAGVLWEDNPGTASGPPPLQTEYAHGSTDYIVSTPEAGSAAYQSAAGDRIAVDDFFGRIRGVNPSKGAVEPSA